MKKIINVPLVILCCCSLTATLTAQDAFRIDKVLKNYVTSVDIAAVLPLPGKFDGPVTVAGSIKGIALRRGKDRTKMIENKPSFIAEKKPSDIIITSMDSSSFIFAVESNEALPMYLVLNNKNLEMMPVMDFEGGLRAGRTIRLSKGQITVTIVDRKTGKDMGSIKYTIHDEGIIRWNKRNQIPEWYGFTVQLDLTGTY